MPSSPPRRLALTSPYGGHLVNLLVGPVRAAELKQASADFPSMDLTPRQLCDLELLITGAFSPLTGFLGKADYEAVCAGQRLADGRLWPVPITLDVSLAFADQVRIGEPIALRDLEGTMIAVLTPEELWEADKTAEAQQLFGTTAETHPEVRYLLNHTNPVYIAGKLEATQLTTHYDFAAFRRRPEVMRLALEAEGLPQVIGFQPASLIHRVHVEFTRRVAAESQAAILINAAMGHCCIESGNHAARVRSYRAVLDYYGPNPVQLNLMPLARRVCGTRETLWHAIINRNYGCSHFVVEHDYAGQGAQANGEPVYGRYTSQEVMQKHAEEVGVQMVALRDLVPEEDRVERFLHPSKKYGRQMEQAREISEWFSYPSVLAELRRSFPARAQQGFTVFFTGLSGAGKSTIANVLEAKLRERDHRPVTLLDGDVVRKHLSSELGFSREHRVSNVRRIGFVASLITKSHGIAICAPIAPYTSTRAEVRSMVESYGGFIEVYVATSLSVCEARDCKGLYAKARAGLVKGFTGISDPYEPPSEPEVVIDTAGISPEMAADQILYFLRAHNYLGGDLEERSDLLAAPTASPITRILRQESFRPSDQQPEGKASEFSKFNRPR